MSLKWIAETLCMGTGAHVSSLLRTARQSQASVKDKDPFPPFPFASISATAAPEAIPVRFYRMVPA